MEKTYKIPEGSEAIVDNMVAVGVERFLAQQMAVKPIQETEAFQTAVDSFRADNKMQKKFEKAEVVEEEVLQEVDKIV